MRLLDMTEAEKKTYEKLLDAVSTSEPVNRSSRITIVMQFLEAIEFRLKIGSAEPESWELF